MAEDDPNDQRPDVCVTLMSGPYDGQTYIFPAPTGSDPLLISIGRRESCDIVINYDAQVSRVHAYVIYDPRDTEYFLEDANSRNGTYLGSAQTRISARVHIEPGTFFRIGHTWLRLDPLPKLAEPQIN